MNHITGSASQVWKSTIKAVIDSGISFEDHVNRICQEIIGLQIQITKFDDIEKPLLILSQFPKWIYPKPQEIKDMTLEGKLSQSYAYSYGERMFAYQSTKSQKHTIDQVNEFIIPLLQQDPNSRRAIISLWNPAKDTVLTKKTVPGLVLIDCKIRNGKLYITSVIRSCDVFMGLPANMYQLFVLAQYIVKKINVEIGTITIHATSAHIFKDQMDNIKTIL
jgi:thymidylate synthase (methanogen type)